MGRTIEHEEISMKITVKINMFIFFILNIYSMKMTDVKKIGKKNSIIKMMCF